MSRPLLLALLAVPLIAPTAMAQDTPRTIPSYGYTALTATTASRQGEVVVNGSRWDCTGTRCRIEAPWAAPTVANCRALVRAVGAVRTFGRDRDAHLTPAQLRDCNTMPASAGSKNPAPTSSSGAADAARRTPAPGTRPVGSATGAAADNAIRGQVLRNRVGVNFTPPEVTDSATAVKVRLLRELGVQVRPSAFGTAIWLTPQRPYMDAKSYLRADAYPSEGRTSFDATAEMPYGSISMTGSDVPGGWAMHIYFANDPARYFFAQCVVGGRPEYGITRVPGERRLPARDGRLNFVIEPALERPRGITIWGVGRERDTWKFGGCEITPFSL